MTPTWQTDDGRVQLYRGDCLEVMRLMRGVVSDLVLTDPPYGINLPSKQNNFGLRTDLSRRKSDNWDTPINKEIFPEIFRVSKNQIVFGANYYWESFYSSGCYIVWDKRGNLPNVPFAPTEFAWTSFKQKQSKKYTIINHGFIKDCREEKTVHPTQKPIKLFIEIAKDFSDINDLILDPFMGSGTTGVACVQLGRRFIGIELDEKYFAIAQRRIEDALKEKRTELPFMREVQQELLSNP